MGTRHYRRPGMTLPQLARWLLDGAKEVPAPEYVDPSLGPCMEVEVISTHKSGYVLIHHKGVNRKSHRIVYRVFKGPIKKGLFVCHKCDNRACINPEHLFLGDHDANQRDKVTKGRQASGESVGTAKLTDDNVRWIKKAYAAGGWTLKELGDKFGVAFSNISNVVNGKAWKHVGMDRPNEQSKGGTMSKKGKATINRFSGDNAFLSNFYEHPLSRRFNWRGRMWWTAEHAFQAAKTRNLDDVVRIQKASSPSWAKRLGRQVELRPNWEKVKVKAMYSILKAKFKDCLLYTSPSPRDS